jgi:hypothetical protein
MCHLAIRQAYIGQVQILQREPRDSTGVAACSTSGSVRQHAAFEPFGTVRYFPRSPRFRQLGCRRKDRSLKCGSRYRYSNAFDRSYNRTLGLIMLVRRYALTNPPQWSRGQKLFALTDKVELNDLRGYPCSDCKTGRMHDEPQSLNRSRAAQVGRAGSQLTSG